LHLSQTTLNDDSSTHNDGWQSDTYRRSGPLGRSPVLTRYSKAPEFGYTPNARAEVLREARRQHRDEIRKGIAWLEERAKADRAVAEVVKGVGV